MFTVMDGQHQPLPRRRARPPAGSFRLWKNLPWTGSWALLRPLPRAASGALRGAHAAAGCPVTRPAAPQAGGECPWSRPALDGCTQLSRWLHKPNCFPIGFLLAGPPRLRAPSGTTWQRGHGSEEKLKCRRTETLTSGACTVFLSHALGAPGRGGAWSFPENGSPA